MRIPHLCSTSNLTAFLMVLLLPFSVIADDSGDISIQSGTQIETAELESELAEQSPLETPNETNPLPQLPEVDSARGVVVLQYHHISTETPPITSTSPEMFETHLKLIEEEGFTVKSLPWVMEQLQQRQPIPDKTIVITFDDGYTSIYETAFPLLKARGWPFTIFVCPEPIDRNFSDSMSWEQLKEMQDAGATIANHSYKHNYLLDREAQEDGTLESDDAWLERTKQDILKTEARIKEMLGVEHKMHAYPYGEYNQAIQNFLREEGFIAFGQQSGVMGYFSDETSLPRYPAASIYANPVTLKTKLYTLPFHVLDEPKETELDSVTVPTLNITVKPNGFRKAQIQCYYQGDKIETRVSETLRNEETVIEIQAKAEKLGSSRRHRYNCTAPTMDGKRYFWFSHSWVRNSSHDG